MRQTELLFFGRVNRTTMYPLPQREDLRCWNGPASDILVLSDQPPKSKFLSSIRDKLTEMLALLTLRQVLTRAGRAR